MLRAENLRNCVDKTIGWKMTIKVVTYVEFLCGQVCASGWQGAGAVRSSLTTSSQRSSPNRWVRVHPTNIQPGWLFRRGVLWIGCRCGRHGSNPAFCPRQHHSRRRERSRGGWILFCQFYSVADWATPNLSGILWLTATGCTQVKTPWWRWRETTQLFLRRRSGWIWVEENGKQELHQAISKIVLNLISKKDFGIAACLS